LPFADAQWARLKPLLQPKCRADGRDLPFYWGAFVLVGE
jgi:CHAT domain-containing protein